MKNFALMTAFNT